MDSLKFSFKYELKVNGDTSQNLFVKSYFGSSLIDEQNLGNISDIVANKKENTNLKKALTDIREKIDMMKCEFELNEYVTDFIEKLDNELRIIDKVDLGGEK